jgi:sortase (surface protein transpeptidase)
LVIDAIGLDAAIEPVGLADDGSLAPPESASRVGWFSQSSRPGELGPAVFVGHLDSLDGPAVFARLRDLVVGDLVRVGRADGSSASYVVSAVDRYPRESFPTEAVYGATPESSLRLITCGGPFERGTGYAHNVVVAATPVGG